jgi:hypothetical protein
MGYGTYAVTIIGQKLDRSQLFKVVDVPGCKCNIPHPGDAVFCSKCGKAVVDEVLETIDGINDNGEIGSFDDWEPLPGGVGFYEPWWDERGEEETVFAYSWKVKIEPIGNQPCRSADRGYSLIPVAGMVGENFLNGKMADLEEALKPLGIWNPDQCGVFTILYEAY